MKQKQVNPARFCPDSLLYNYKYYESKAETKYEKRMIEVEHSSFKVLLCSCTGSAQILYARALKEIAAKVNKKSRERTLLCWKTEFRYSNLSQFFVSSPKMFHRPLGNTNHKSNGKFVLCHCL